MTKFMARIKCPNCYFTITCDIETWESTIRCPLCQKVIPVNVINKTNKSNKIIKTIKTDIDNPARPKTREGIIMLLTFLFSLGVVLAILNILIEYRPTYARRSASFTRSRWRHGTTFRQNILIAMTFINWAFILDLPFHEAKEVLKLERSRRMKETRRTSFLYYFTYMCISIVFWYLFLGKYVLLDLSLFYGGTKNKYLIASKYVFYVIMYFASILCCYVPYLIYYGFNLNFGYSDTKRYFIIFASANTIFISIFFLFSMYLNSI